MAHYSSLYDYIVQQGLITREQLASARCNQEQSQDQLDQLLVSSGYCTEEALARARANFAGVPFMALEDLEIDPAAVAALPPEALKKYQVLPVSCGDGKLLMAMQQPDNVMIIDDLRILSGYQIEPLATLTSQLAAAIDKYSRIEIELEQHWEAESPVQTLCETGEPYLAVDTPAVRLANEIITQAVSDRASDVHIEPYEKHVRVRYRIDGVLHDIWQLPRQVYASLVSRLKIMADMDIAEQRVPQDGRVTLCVEGENIDIRVASLPICFGERLTLRLLYRSRRMINLAELGMAPDILEQYRNVLNMSCGCILVTGPTGCGKTSTIYASLDNVDCESKNVITVEDPVEYRIEKINQIQINNKAGLTFAQGLRSILRNDPDIIMVGEIRDRETAKLAMEAAMSGHLVFSTLHTNDAPGAIGRLADMGIEPFITASALVCVLAQRLVRLLCSHCKEPYQVTREELRAIPGFPLADDEPVVELFRPRGCMRCSYTGYRGRVGVFELLFVSPAIKRMALDRRPANEIKDLAVQRGMITLRQDGFFKVKQGSTALEEVVRVCSGEGEQDAFL